MFLLHSTLMFKHVMAGLATNCLRVLQRSQRVGEDGIGALFGEPNANITSAAASIRAWRPVQACTPILIQICHIPRYCMLARSGLLSQGQAVLAAVLYFQNKQMA